MKHSIYHLHPLLKISSSKLMTASHRNLLTPEGVRPFGRLKGFMKETLAKLSTKGDQKVITRRLWSNGSHQKVLIRKLSSEGSNQKAMIKRLSRKDSEGLLQKAPTNWSQNHQTNYSELAKRELPFPSSFLALSWIVADCLRSSQWSKVERLSKAFRPIRGFPFEHSNSNTNSSVSKRQHS